jgi:hypothetical protein
MFPVFRVGHPAHRPHGMIGRHALLRRRITEQGIGVLVISTHRVAPVPEDGIMVVQRDHRVDSLGAGVSATCWQPVVKVDHRLLVTTKPGIMGCRIPKEDPQSCSSALHGFVYWQAVPTFTTAC